MSGETILICSELGTGSTEIAEIVSKRLNLEVYNTDRLLRQVAATLSLSFQQLASRSVSGEVDVDQLLFSYALEVMEEGKAIFEGRSSFLLLLAPISLRVFLTALEHMRTKHVADLRGISHEKALAEIRSSDQDRQNLARKICKVDWKEPNLYDLIVNTGGLRYEDVAELIIDSYNRKREA